jgi:UDP-glucuronate 4-epimerase
MPLSLLVLRGVSELRILITGSAGFIGANLFHALSKGTNTVLGIDNFSKYYSPQMKLTRSNALGVKHLDIDISDFFTVQAIMREFMPTHVIHLAAQGGVRASKSDPKPYLQANQQGFLNLLTISEDIGVKKFIYASSSSVYGDGLKPPFKESDTLPSPKSLYALSKLSNELIAKHLPKKNTQRIGLRFFTVYGPWGRPDMAVFRLLASAKLGVAFELTAAGDVVRDFTFVDDVSKVISQLMLNELAETGSEIFNVAASKPWSLNDLFAITSELGINPIIRSSDADNLDVQITHGSVEKLQSFNIEVPNTSLKSGIGQTWNWIQDQDLDDLRSWFEYKP